MTGSATTKSPSPAAKDYTIFKAVRTAPDRCRVCYTCVRECPAKAIRIIEGQATVLHDRCIGCGNCVRVCSQGAKVITDSTAAVRGLLSGPRPVTAIVAPSFPADFPEFDYRILVGMIRGLGFARVNEVAFGADLVADRYHRLLDEGGGPYIATSCPAVVFYVEKYHPELIGRLAPIVSPMAAAARALRERAGEEIRVVFIGPCTAKKIESRDRLIEGEIDEVLTFVELRRMFAESGLDPEAAAPSDFDPPRGGLGTLFPLHGGLLQAADLKEDLLTSDVVTASGRRFTSAIEEFRTGGMRTRLLEILACDGCIMGAGMSTADPLFRRRSRISDYARQRAGETGSSAGEDPRETFRGLDLSRSYADLDQRLRQPAGEDITAILQRMGKFKPEDELNCGACGYPSCREHAVAILKDLAESEMCLPYTIDRLNLTVGELARSNRELAATQEALMQSERLASMGQLAAGIAHEVNNPLGVVLMYAHLMLEDLQEESRLKNDARTIVEQADRCKKIVNGLLHFSRQNKVLREPVDIRDLVARGCRMVVKPENVAIEVQDRMENPVAEVDREQLLQVLTNLLTNSFAAMPDGGRIAIAIADQPRSVIIAVSDTGVGIPAENLSKIFEPFFTTKQIGKGTGLGLAVTYGIIKMHRGEIAVESNADPAAGPTGTKFTIDLPRHDPGEQPL